MTEEIMNAMTVVVMGIMAGLLTSFIWGIAELIFDWNDENGHNKD